MKYEPLEPKSLSAIGVDTPTFGGTESAGSLLTTSTFIYSLLFTAIIVGAFYRYVIAGVYRMQASEFSIRKSNEIIKQVTLGLLGVFSLFLILFTINKGLVTGEVTLDDLKSRMPAGGTTQSNTSNTGSIDIVPSSGSGGSSKSCASKEAIIASLSGGLCANTSCGILSGCNWQQYDSIITSAAGGDAQLRKMVIVTMCKESTAKPNSAHKNPNGSYDCGLMQINQNGPCEQNPSQTSQEENIRKGVALMKEKMRNVSGFPIVPGVPALGNVFASYNCCANGDRPASQSVDCSTAAGFPSGFPKWACPINPGVGDFNMCVVKNYACELVVCMDKI